MSLPDKGYDAGRVDTELKGINRRLDDIADKLDKNLDWQMGIESRLAAGNVKFKNIVESIAEIKKAPARNTKGGKENNINNTFGGRNITFKWLVEKVMIPIMLPAGGAAAGAYIVLQALGPK